MSELVVPFPGQNLGDPTAVGGKGASLIRLAAAELPVPAGAVLTTSFFEPWFKTLEQTPEWKALVDAEPDQWPNACQTLQNRCTQLSLVDTQQKALAELRDILHDLDESTLFAVRSSSPEEDLSGASFAGGYETRLGVRPDKLEEAIRCCFASSLDVRVLIYKQEQGFDPLRPSIAVVVQCQINSRIAGVGFSINPLTNDFDEAVINANWGLGDTVVSGAVSPDQFVVNKVTSEVLETQRGKKQTSLLLDPDGGHTERRAHRSDELTLSETQLTELVRTLGQIEKLYETPVDIEWAYDDDGKLHMLQARPITTYVPLPTSMLTEPGERRRLYMDIALSGGLTTNAPISPIGQSLMARFFTTLIEGFVGKLRLKLEKGDELWMLEGGRMYQDLSNIFWLTSPKQLAKNQRAQDALMADILANIDRKTYKSARRPAWARLSILPVVLRFYWGARRLIWNTFRAALFPKRAREHLDREVKAFETELSSIPEELSISEILRQKSHRVVHHVLGVTMPPVFMAIGGLAIVNRLVPKRFKELADRVGRGFDGNVVVDMGIALFRMAGLLNAQDLSDPQVLAKRLRDGELPSEFLTAWQNFIENYGWRGPHEVDLGSPKYSDDPALALSQMCAMVKGDFDPEAAQTRHIAERKQAAEELLRRLGLIRRAIFRRIYRWIDLFGGTRDTPKHEYLMFFAAIRRRALDDGEKLVVAGRLDEAEQVFDLTLEQLADSQNDPDLDLRLCCKKNTRFLKKLQTHVRSFPAVIDSRGRILRPAPRVEVPGQLTGMPISPGIARGPAKILHRPDEKTVEPGDILVAHTTDPGWTPLFVNAAAVVLSVGGVLQHGAVVAREYGKPCVAGIDDVLNRLSDGQIVEVDGSAGVVRVIDPES